MIVSHNKGFRSSYDLVCSVCGKTVEDFETFGEAVAYKKEEGWKSDMSFGYWEDWKDSCPDCASYFND